MSSLFLHGRRSFHKWRHIFKFSQNKSHFSKPFSSTSPILKPISITNPKSQTFTVVSYLIESLSLSPNIAESISKKITFSNRTKPDSVLSLLRLHGFTDSQISSIITSYPQVLTLDSETSLGPKLNFLKSRTRREEEEEEITQILTMVPKILSKKGDKTISRYYDFVKEIINLKPCKISSLSQDCISSSNSNLENKIRNVLALRDLGVPQKRLFTLLISNFQPVCGKSKFQESLKRVLDMGFDPKTSKFIDALRVVYGYSEKTIDEKIKVYESLGFDVKDVWDMFKKCPFFLNFSEKKISDTYVTLMSKCGLHKDGVVSVFKASPRCIGASEKRIVKSVETFIGLGFSRDEYAMIVKRYPSCMGYSSESVKKKTMFLVKKMGWSLKAIASNPAVLGYSFEKRTVPRCDVIKALMSKGFIGDKLPPLSSVLAISNEDFLNKFVLKHEGVVSELMAIFNRGRVSVIDCL
ncbi:unnamed protein product [Cochlearia groenlandica]